MTDTELLDIFKYMLKTTTVTEIEEKVIIMFLNKAKKAIMNYCRITEEEFKSLNLYEEQLQLALYYKKNEKLLGLKQYTEGKRSVTLENDNNTIPKNIKDSLPFPKLKMW